uniref:Secreted protein n=1 Tax=Helianthus annuus TaxID=4232 RepID=A0A251T6K1_HELAN
MSDVVSSFHCRCFLLLLHHATDGVFLLRSGGGSTWINATMVDTFFSLTSEHACVLRLFKRLVWTDHPSLTKSWCLTWLFRTSNPMKIKVHLLCQRVITKGSSS